MRTPKRSRIATETGLILMDPSLTIIALDRGAASILNSRVARGVKHPVYTLPEQILDALRGHDFADLSCLQMSLRVGIGDYICRAYFVEWRDGIVPRPIVALVLENQSSAISAINNLAAQYHLTKREQEALRGMSMGLGSKELAERMNISPSTLRTFLRLMKIKMGATSRAGMLTRILQNTHTKDNETDSP